MKTTNILYFLSIALLLGAFILLTETETGRATLIAGMLTFLGIATNIFAFAMNRFQKS